MRFAPSPEQLEFASSLRELLAKADVPAVIRAWSAGDPTGGRALWGRLADAGVTALALPEEHGGFGATSVDLVLAFTELGRAAVPGPYVETVAVAPSLLPASDTLSGIAAGTTIVSLAWSPHVPLAVDGGAADVLLEVDGTSVYSASAGMRVASAGVKS